MVDATATSTNSKEVLGRWTRQILIWQDRGNTWKRMDVRARCLSRLLHLTLAQHHGLEEGVSRLIKELGEEFRCWKASGLLESVGQVSFLIYRDVRKNKKIEGKGGRVVHT